MNARAKAWETRRAKYGAAGHGSSYSRGPRSCASCRAGVVLRDEALVEAADAIVHLGTTQARKSALWDARSAILSRRTLPTLPAPPDPCGSVLKVFIILQDAGCAPEKKGPFPERMVEAFVREARQRRPADSKITIAQLTWNLDLWVQSADEYLSMIDLAQPRRGRRAAA